jgi:hypothetical protein
MDRWRGNIKPKMRMESMCLLLEKLFREEVDIERRPE